MKVLQNKGIVLFVCCITIFSTIHSFVHSTKDKLEKYKLESFKLGFEVYKKFPEADVLITSFEYSPIALVITEVFCVCRKKLKRHVVINKIEDLCLGNVRFKKTDRVLIVGGKDFLQGVYTSLAGQLEEKNILKVCVEKRFPSIDIKAFMKKRNVAELETFNDKLATSLYALVTFTCRLARKIKEKGFRPDYIIGLWRGGVPIAVWLEKALHLLGVEVKQVISVRTIGYNGFKIKDKIEICDDCHLKSFNFEKNDKILIVDDLIDTGKTIKTIVDWLTRGSFNLVRENVRTAVLFYKKNEHFVPDYYELLFDRWLVFPHELEGLEKNEICDIHGQSVATMLETLLPTIG